MTVPLPYSGSPVETELGPQLAPGVTLPTQHSAGWRPFILNNDQNEVVDPNDPAQSDVRDTYAS